MNRNNERKIIRVWTYLFITKIGDYISIIVLFREDKNINNLNNKKPINISLSLDNSHIYPSLIVMTSALENNDKDKHILIFYLLVSNDFDDNNLEIFESLKLKYDVRINVFFFD